MKPPILFLLFALLKASSIFAQHIDVAASQRPGVTSEILAFDGHGRGVIDSNADHPITAAGYCEFLNAIAATDPHHLYEANSLDGRNGERVDSFILRSGVPGGFHYAVITGKETTPVSFASWLDVARYCNWLENAAATSSFNGCEEVTEHETYELQGDELVFIRLSNIFSVKLKREV